MRRFIPTACTLWMLACGGSVAAGSDPDASSDSTIAIDASGDDTPVVPDAGTDGSAPNETGGGTIPSDAVPVDAAEVCGGKTCAAGQICCIANGTCFDPKDPSACSVSDFDAGSPPGSGTNPSRPGTPPACASNADCWATEYCWAPNCEGAGYCYSRSNCASCGPAGSPGCAVCACNGVSYPDVQSACAAGVRTVTAAQGACGVPYGAPDAGGTGRIPCGIDANCPSGKTCCALYGVCVDPSCAYCCKPAPAGTRYPCGADADCRGGEYCDGVGCGTPGGCRAIGAAGPCGGVLDPVCGCDGKTYTNACWSTAAGARVAHAGSC